jgi:3-deoxy-7-phosphoheptulonate synthase
MPNSLDQIGSSDDTRVNSIEFLPSPERILLEKSINAPLSNQIIACRQKIADIIHGRSDRLLVVVGPCSIHDPESALEYSEYVRGWRELYGDEMEIVMRTYWEKPRTTVGWKGLINDPDLDGSNRVEKGLRTARRLLWEINGKGVPTATEFLDPISPQFYADLISWGAIGARTTESQIHRELASGLSCPVGFKNGTDGSVQIAVDAMRASA